MQAPHGHSIGGHLGEDAVEATFNFIAVSGEDGGGAPGESQRQGSHTDPSGIESHERRLSMRAYVQVCLVLPPDGFADPGGPWSAEPVSDVRA